MLISKKRGVHVKHNKFTKDCAPVIITPPKTVRIPMQMHIGAPATPCVKVTDTVFVGTLIGEPGERLSSPIYSSVSGKVKKIEEVKTASSSTTYVVIESDGEMTPDENIAPPDVTGKEDFIAAIRKSGIVGLGGAGFPTYAKLNVPDGKIDTVVVNGAECEPYITSDTQTMLREPDDVIAGLGAVMKYIGVPKAVIGVEKNKPECIAKLRASIKDENISVKPLPAVYPQGGEKVLVLNTTGRIIPEGKLPLDVGVIVINCTTLAAISKYLKTGMPLTQKCVTIDGPAIAEPKNVIAPVGTSVKDLIDFCGGFKSEPKKMFLGGPMMGIPIADIDTPITKQTNAVISLDEAAAKKPDISECIKCGKCASVCPLLLTPFEIGIALKLKKPEELEKLKVNLCMECGCCSFICPAHRELVQQNKLAKAMLRQYQKSKSGGAK